MPLFSLEKIRALAQTRQVYLRGVGGYNAGWVEEYSSAPQAFYTEYITARVKEGAAAYRVEVGFDGEGTAAHMVCDCKQFHPRQGACKHILSVLVYKYYRDMTEEQPAAPLVQARRKPVTAPAAQQLIDRYMTEETLRLTACGARQQVGLFAELNIDTEWPTVSFSVGLQRPYHIKNLSRFCQWMRSGERVRYGKELELVHHPESFRPAHRLLLQFILAEWGERSAPFGTLYTAGSSGQAQLSPAAFDRLFSVLADGTVTLREGENRREILLRDGCPSLTVTLMDEGEGVRLHSEAVRYVVGANRLYVLQGDTLYRTHEEYTRCMSDWVRGCSSAADGLFVAAAQLPAFCGGVLKTVRPYIHLEGERLLRKYAPTPMQAKIWLDAPSADVITAQVVFDYGEASVEPYGESARERTVQRDTLGELAVTLAVERLLPARQEGTGLPMLCGGEEELFSFVTQGVEELRQVATVYASDTLEAWLSETVPTVRYGVSLMGDLLEMAVEAEQVDPRELAGILNGYREHRSFHRLKDGRFVQLEEGALADLAELADSLGLTSQELRSGRVSLPKYRAFYLEKLLRKQPAVIRDESFRDLVSRWEEATGQEWPVPQELQGVLRGYQKEGYCWLRTMECMGFGGILADDMGLGKTLQVIALFLAAAEQKSAPSLVVCPTSVVLGWEQEIARFAPSLRVLCVIGDAATRRQLLEQAHGYDVLVTSYDMLKRDVQAYEQLQFHYHILDEAQYIKNSRTQNARAVKTIRSMQRFALTGTPVENRLAELWSMFDFLMPGLLFSYAKFRHRYEQPIARGEDDRITQRLSGLVSPFILRRLKQQVLAELPPKTERVLFATMERPQRQVYADSLGTLRRQLMQAGDRLTGQGRITVLAMLTRLRQLCCDPRLCCEGYTGGSCKLEACMELLREAAAGGHKVLLFSQFTSMLALLRQRLDAEGVPYYVLQGSTPKQERARLVEAFNRDATPVFLISLKAGGTGLNLTGADVVIHYDPWWNAAAENQATDRAHRIGQQQPVQVVRLIAKDTVEETILQLQEQKKQLAQTVVRAGGSVLTELTPAEWLELLE